MISKPLIHPAILALVCPDMERPRFRASQHTQAEAAGISLRTFSRNIVKDWVRWPLEPAVRWCEYCGVDYWKLASQTQITPKMLSLTRWDVRDPRVRRALTLACRANGVEPTEERLKTLAEALTRASSPAYVGTYP